MRLLTRVVLAVAAAWALGTAPPWTAVKPVPTPAQVIGFAPGTERKLADFGQISGYFKALAASSPRVQLFTIGKSTEGRDMVLAAISSEENLRRLARFQDIARQLADSRGVTDDQPHRLARAGKVIGRVDLRPHAAEAAPAG